MFALISPDQSIYVRTLMDTKRHKHFRLLHVDLYNSIHIDMGQYNVDVSCHTDTNPSCPSIINNGAWMSRLQKWFSCVMLCDNVYIPHLPYSTCRSLHKMRFGQYQASLTVLRWPGNGDCILCHAQNACQNLIYGSFFHYRTFAVFMLVM